MIRFFCYILTFSLLQSVSHASCGHELNVVIKYDPSKKTAEMVMFNFIDEEFCDSGLVEDLANYQVELFTASKKVYSKKIYINDHTQLEAINSKTKTFTQNKPSFEPQFRNVKFSIDGSMKELKRYKITQLNNKIVVGEGVIK